MELVNECYPTGKFRKVDTRVSKYYSYEKELLDALPLTVHALHKSKMEYDGKFGYTIGRIQHIGIMSIIEISYTACCLSNQTVSHTLPGLQGIKRCIQYLASHPHKPIFYPSNYYDGSNFIRITWNGNQF